MLRQHERYYLDEYGCFGSMNVGGVYAARARVDELT